MAKDEDKTKNTKGKKKYMIWLMWPASTFFTLNCNSINQFTIKETQNGTPINKIKASQQENIIIMSSWMRD